MNNSSTAYPVSSIGILLLSNSYEKVHYGFVLAAGALASNRKVVMFATNFAIHGLCKHWQALDGSAMEQKHIISKGVAGLEELREAVISLGGSLYACEAGMKIASLSKESLLSDVEICGVVTFLEKTRHAQLISL